MSKKMQSTPMFPGWLGLLCSLGVVVFVGAISLFAIRNNDIWWHLAVGKITAGGHFIRQDPFMFSVPGAPWVPHAWLSSLLFYTVYTVASFAGLVAFRAFVVALIFVLILWVTRRLGVSLVLAMPVVLVAALNAHSRFILRPHLFEYLFVLLLLAYLVSKRERHGWRFFVFPVILQMVWVNMHASFYLGPILVLLFYLGESLSRRLRSSWSTETLGVDRDVDWQRVGLLVGLMAVASFVNPSPIEFVLQPLQSEQRELLTRYTLEWRSPLDPFLRNAAFHPYYEIGLGFAVLAFLVSIRRLKLASLLIVGFFAFLSLKAHRFRVEFALVSVPLVLDQLRSSPLVQGARTKLAKSVSGRWAIAGAAIVLSLVLVVTARDRFEFGEAVSDRFPTVAMNFVRDENIAQRSFHTVGFGSYLIWELYPERQSFVDGRNINAEIYRDFLACQQSSTGFNNVARKYELDAFLLPVPAKSDGGMTNVHNFLTQASNWTLVHVDRVACVYARRNSVPEGWLGRNEFTLYNPLTFAKLRFTQEQVPVLVAEMQRAVDADASNLRPLLDLAKLHAAIGDMTRGREFLDRALEIDADDPEAKSMLDAVGGR